jgi:hypothetical protein
MTLIVQKSTIEEFAAKLSESIATRYPPQIDNDRSKRPSEERLTRIIEDACGRAITFRDEHRLGWLGKARLGNALRWQLVDRGYRKEFVELVTEAMIVKLSQGKPSAT